MFLLHQQIKTNKIIGNQKNCNLPKKGNLLLRKVNYKKINYSIWILCEPKPPCEHATEQDLFFFVFGWGVANQKKNNHLINCIVKQFCNGCKKEEIINHLSISHSFPNSSKSRSEIEKYNLHTAKGPFMGSGIWMKKHRVYV